MSIAEGKKNWKKKWKKRNEMTELEFSGMLVGVGDVTHFFDSKLK